MSRLLVDGWQVVIGIETHAQIKSRQKLFSSASTAFLTDPPNTKFNVVDAAFPGTLPKLNPKCLLLALRAALALDCTVHKRSSFDRKHYFYSDLPLGYQITQHYAPFASNGRLKLPKLDHPVRIKQIQIEQDTAKSTLNPRARTSQIDLNRAGSGLLEIVTEPDLRSPEEAAEYVRTLQSILRAVGASDGNMEAGSLRCDVNVSINRPGDPPGTRCELKNLNSVRYMVGAIKYEIERQKAILTSPSTISSEPPFVPQETRAFDHHKWETYKLRSKEDAPDYRYMPDANLGVVHVTDSQIEHIRETLPALPATIRTHLLETYCPSGVTEKDVDVLLTIDAGEDVGFDGEVPELGAVSYYQDLCSGGRDPKVVMNWVINSLLGQLSKLDKTFADRPSVALLGNLIDLVESGKVTRSSSNLLLRHILTNDIPASHSVEQIAKQLDLLSFTSTTPNGATNSSSDAQNLRTICAEIMEALPSEVAAVRAGHINVMNRLVGRVIKQTRGKADAQYVRKVLEDLLW